LIILLLSNAADQETKKAIHECLKALLEVDVDELRGKKLEGGDFRAIVAAKDPERMLLRWMDDPGKVKAAAAWFSARPLGTTGR
jgi:hypothetical protein